MCKGALSRRVGTWRRRVGTYINYQVTISVSIRALISIHIVVEKGQIHLQIVMSSVRHHPCRMKLRRGFESFSLAATMVSCGPSQGPN